MKLTEQDYKGSITYVIHSDIGKPDKVVTVYKPSTIYYLALDLIKFRKLPAMIPNVGITIVAENPEDVEPPEVTE